MVKVLFVCHGNICRSPMAEFILKKLVKERVFEQNFIIESCATSAEELGNTVYPSAKEKLREHGIDCSGKIARQLKSDDFINFDYVIAMELFNIRNMKKIYPKAMTQYNKFKEKNFYEIPHLANICRLLDFSGNPKDIDDPWYSGDFETTFREISLGCTEFLNYLDLNVNSR